MGSVTTGTCLAHPQVSSTQLIFKLDISREIVARGSVAIFSDSLGQCCLVEI